MMRMQRVLSVVWGDLTSALRAARRDRTVSAIVVLSLAAGVGMNTLVYSAVDTILIRPLPYPESDRLAVLYEGDTREPDDRGGVAPADFLEWRRRVTSFSGIAAAAGAMFNLSGSADPERVQASRVSASFFTEVLRTRLLLGRGFTAEEDEGAVPVAVLSHGLWQRQFGGSPGVLGQSVQLSGKAYTIVGVLSPSVTYPTIADPPSKPQVWVPLSLNANQRTQRGARFLTVFARLRAGVTFEAAQAEMTGVARDLERTYPNANASRGAFVEPLATEVAGHVRTPLRVLAGAVALVLLIACVNIAALVLTRTVGRSREVAVRLGLGATRGQVARQLLIENLFMALIGGAVGVALAAAGRRIVIALGSATVPQLEHLVIDGRVLGFALVVTIITGMAFGVVPALQASSVDVNELLKQSGRSISPGRKGRAALNGMVVVQFAMSVVLLLGAGLLMRSFLELQRVDLGFQPGGILTFETSLPPSRYTTPQYAPTIDDMLGRIRALPTVRAAGAVNELPLGGDFTWTFQVESSQMPKTGPLPVADYRIITPGYLQAMSIGLLRGRVFTDQDVGDSHAVAIISESMARRYWPNEDALDKRIRLEGPIERYPWLTIVGVVRDVHHTAIDTAPAPALYRPHRQHAWPNMAMVVRTAGDPGDLVSSVRGRIAEVDRDLPLANIREMSAVVSSSIALRRFTLFVIASFAALALVVALAGVYGILSYMLAQRVQELGVRIALGASPAQVLGLTFWSGMRLVIVGIAAGTLGSFAAARIIATLLYGVTATDVLTYVAVVFTATIAAAAACLMSSWRALRLDPIAALRHN